MLLKFSDTDIKTHYTKILSEFMKYSCFILETQGKPSGAGLPGATLEICIFM